eukprot:Skav217179  [mRNA]  locus=scaffold5232:58633:60224:+ [translate_table: standard]
MARCSDFTSRIITKFRLEEMTVLYKSSNANVAQLAASIKHRILENELCEIDCLGPDAIFRSLAAMDLATVFVKRERSEQLILCLRPEEMHVTSDMSQDQDLSGDEPGQMQRP